MALETKDNETCPKCKRYPVRIYKTQTGWMCGKYARQVCPETEVTHGQYHHPE